MAEAYNVQLFVTTHNADSLKGIYESMAQGDVHQPPLSFYKLIKRTDNQCCALHYAYKDFALMMELENEIR